MARLKLASIEWIDHSSYSANQWHHQDEVASLKPLQITSVGYVIRETKKRIVIAAHVTSNGKCCGEMCIIKKCITKFKILN